MKLLLARALAACLSIAALAACHAAPESPLPMNLPLPPRPFACVLPEPMLATEAQREAHCHAQQAQADACTASDGDWGVAGLSPPGTQPHCTWPTPDAGRTCTANYQCRQSACGPDVGAEQALPGRATGHCDKYGRLYPHCDATVAFGNVNRPEPCPLY